MISGETRSEVKRSFWEVVLVMLARLIVCTEFGCLTFEKCENFKRSCMGPLSILFGERLSPILLANNILFSFDRIFNLSRKNNRATWDENGVVAISQRQVSQWAGYLKFIILIYLQNEPFKSLVMSSTNQLLAAPTNNFQRIIYFSFRLHWRFVYFSRHFEKGFYFESNVFFYILL